jgi:simple sugar transport system permease protein
VSGAGARTAAPRALVALLVVGVLFNAFCLAAGSAPLTVLRALVQTTVASPYGAAQLLFKATPFLFLGVAAALAFSAGQLNIGLEGQLLIGSLAMGIAGTYLPAEMNGALAAALLCVVGMAAGALWAMLPALLKHFFAAPEVMTSIMTNFVAALTASLVLKPFAVSESTHTRALPKAFLFTSIESLVPATKGAQLGTAFVLALCVVAAAHVFLFRTRTGFLWRAFGSNPRAAKLYGAPTTALMLSAFAVSGALSGLGACAYVLGSKGFHEDGFSGGIGFLALGVALLGRNEPLYVVPAALLFGLLSYGSLAVNAYVPKEMTDVLTAAIMAVAIAQGRKR